MRLLSILLLAAIGLSACTTTYKDVASSDPSAKVTLNKGYEGSVGFGKASGQGYYFYENGDCTQPTNAAQFTFITGDRKDRIVRANTPLYLLGTISDHTPGATYSCSIWGEFNPEEGGDYNVTMSGVGTGCDLNVVDKATGTTVSSFTKKAPDFEGFKCKK